jgi:hypothetical protein
LRCNVTAAAAAARTTLWRTVRPLAREGRATSSYKLIIEHFVAFPLANHDEHKVPSRRGRRAGRMTMILLRSLGLGAESRPRKPPQPQASQNKTIEEFFHFVH